MQQTLTVNFTLVISSVLSLPAFSPPTGVVGQAYSFQLPTAIGGVPPYTYSATGLPTGLTCSPSGLISGTPTSGGSFSCVLTVKDSGQ